MVLQALHHTTRSQMEQTHFFNHFQSFHDSTIFNLCYFTMTMQPSCLLYSQPALPVACKCQRWPAQSVAISSLSWCLLGWCRDPKRTRREGQGPLAVALSPSLGHPIIHLMCLSDFCRTAQHGLWLWHPTRGLTLHCTHWTVIERACDPFTWQNSFPLWPSRAYVLSWRSHCHIHHCSWYPGLGSAKCRWEPGKTNPHRPAVPGPRSWAPTFSATIEVNHFWIPYGLGFND